jgi:hypothetical protein
MTPANCAHDWRELAPFCVHALERARTGTPIRCASCGALAHRWNGHVCGARLPKHPDKARAAIAAERARCPVTREWDAAANPQQQQLLSAPPGRCTCPWGPLIGRHLGSCPAAAVAAP